MYFTYTFGCEGTSGERGENRILPFLPRQKALVRCAHHRSKWKATQRGSTLSHRATNGIGVPPCWHSTTSTKCQRVVRLPYREIMAQPTVAQFNCRGLASVLEEANIQVLPHSENSQGWQMGDTRCELGLKIASPFYSYMNCLRTIPVPGASI